MNEFMLTDVMQRMIQVRVAALRRENDNLRGLVGHAQRAESVRPLVEGYRHLFHGVLADDDGELILRVDRLSVERAGLDGEPWWRECQR